MDFEEIRELAKHHKQSFGRILKCEMYSFEGGRLLTITRLHDDFHDMNLAILLSDSYRIEEIAGKMDRIPSPAARRSPWRCCRISRGSASWSGGLKKVKERIPRNMRCTHIYEMLQSTFRSIFVGLQHPRPEVGRSAHPRDGGEPPARDPVPGAGRHLLRLQPGVG